MIAVYIREEEELDGEFLDDDFTPTHLPQLVHIFSTYKTFLHSLGQPAKGTGEGQFVSTPEGVYFEIIVKKE